MRWNEEEPEITLPARAIRPASANFIVGPACRFRHPAEQAEIERRVAIYVQQVEQTGRITWLPRKGQGSCE